MLIDSHCHLDFPEFAPERDAVVARARAAGLRAMITISTRVGRFGEIAALAGSYADVFCTVGTHPLQAADEPDVAVETLLDLAAHPKCVGIGEAGLDYHYDAAPRDVAARVFRTHIAAARRSGLPLVIHTRDADADTAAILEDEMARGPFPAVLHCFTAGAALADIAVALGLFISFSGRRHLQERRRPPGDRGPDPARSHPRRDGRTLPRTRSAPRHPQRAGLRRPYGPPSSRACAG